MSTITIPKKITKGEELIVIPRKDYKEFVQWKEMIESFRIFIPTKEQKGDLKRARRDYKNGKYLTINELKRKLGIKNSK